MATSPVRCPCDEGTPQYCTVHNPPPKTGCDYTWRASLWDRLLGWLIHEPHAPNHSCAMKHHGVMPDYLPRTHVCGCGTVVVEC